MFILTKEVRFEAAHRLPDSTGPCRNLHGHSYRVVVEIAAPWVQESGEEDGMVIDFDVITQIIRRFDHKVLNDEEPFAKGFPPTAEYLAWHFAKEIAEALQRRNPDARLVSVTVWETENSSVTYIPEVETV